MTTTAVVEFLGKVKEDADLQADVSKAMEAEDDRQAVTDLANGKGYNFTAEELAAEMQRRQEEVNNRQDAGELTDDELEAVAGGELVVSALVVSAASAGATAVVSVKSAKW